MKNIDRLEEIVRGFAPIKELHAGATCPVSGELLVIYDDPIYMTEKSRKLWKYDHVFDVLIELAGSGRVYSYNGACWKLQKIRYYESTLGPKLKIDQTYNDCPGTNWGVLLLNIRNFLYTNIISVGILKVWRKIFPKKLLFPTVVKVASTTIAQDLVPVKPMSKPEGLSFYMDYKDKDETKPSEHVIINDEKSVK